MRMMIGTYECCNHIVSLLTIQPHLEMQSMMYVKPGITAEKIIECDFTANCERLVQSLEHPASA